MTMIDYTTTLAAMDAALSASSGANLAVGQKLRDTLYQAGSTAAAVWTTEIDTAKAAWVSAATAAFNAAKAAADKVLGSVSSVTFNEYDFAEIRALLLQAVDAAANDTVGEIISANIGELGAADSADGAFKYASPAGLSTWHYKATQSARQLELETYAAMQAAQAWLDFIA